jgi:hypothetical protein
MPTGRRRGREPGRRPGHARAPPGALGPPPAAPGSRHSCRGKDVRYGRAPSGEACVGPRFARPRHRRRVRRRSLPGVLQLHRLLEAHAPRAVDDRRGRHGGPCRGTPWSSATCSGEAARELLPCEAVRSGRFQADSRARPLRRRAPMMARPARVRMRNRKPWVLARRRLFGWKVRFTSGLQRSTAGHNGSGPTTARARGRACTSEPSSDRSTVRGSAGQGQTGRTNQRRIRAGRVRTRYPRIPAADAGGDTPRTPEIPVDSG